jgi:hypothetical protein
MQEVEDFKRPDHPDFMDASELKKIEWSGYRLNTLTQYAEIWLLGERMADISPAQLRLNPNAVQEAMAEIFGIDSPVLPDTPEARAYGKARDKLIS